MNKVAGFFLLGLAMGLPAQAQTLIFEEDFEGGAADWRAPDYVTPAIYIGSGGHDGGAYISVPQTIDTTSGGQMGGYVAARCASGAPNPPAAGINCSGGAFKRDWYFDTPGVQELRVWMRHNCSPPGGFVPTLRVAIPFNSPGGSAIFPVMAPSADWTQLVVPIDIQDPLWDDTWGSLVPDATAVLENVGRIQPGYLITPDPVPAHMESCTIDIDDVGIYGATLLPADVISKNSLLHIRHDGPLAAAGINDDVRVRVLGSSVLAGDPVDIDTDDILAASVRIGRKGGDTSGTKGPGSQYNLNEDGDGLDDAEFRSLMGSSLGARNPDGTGGSCAAHPGGTWSYPTSVELRAELTSGEIIAGEDTTINVDCVVQCHN